MCALTCMYSTVAAQCVFGSSASPPAAWEDEL